MRTTRYTPVPRLHAIEPGGFMQLVVCPQGCWSSTATPKSIVVSTPLDVITWLEACPIASVVLAGDFATDKVLATFLAESYPAVHVAQEP